MATNIQILTASSGTYTTPAGATQIVVECWGGGGPGGSVSGYPCAGGGGQGGYYARKTITSPASSYSYAVSLSKASAYSASPVLGGDSTFGSTLCIAKGG